MDPAFAVNWASDISYGGTEIVYLRKCDAKWLIVAPTAIENALSWTDVGYTGKGLKGPFQHEKVPESNVIATEVIERFVQKMGEQQQKV